MSYVVLARKWRPMSFRDLVGQSHVSRTLGNAIDQGRVAHAFLFTGVRGVGKTTSARILAKALNCLDPQRPDDGGIEPCLACSACKEIAEGLDVDVREIDGASYTGVDEIRKLQESLPYPPTRDRFKIFIVDEVHMLSNNAWNALLKTLEEPPPHVKFIFATTEVHKVPVTILSRVQRFDFKMIPTRLIVERVREVLAAEKIEADDRAVTLVARQAAGSMRDALSLLDQVIAFDSEKLDGESVGRVLGVAGYPTLHEIARAVLEAEADAALRAVKLIADQSCDLTVVSRDLLSVFRDLVVAKLCSDDDLLDLADEEREGIRSLAAPRDENDLVRLQRGFAQGFDAVTRSADPRAALEMLLVRLALRPPFVPIDALVARLAKLEARLSSVTGSGQGGSTGAPGGAGRAPAARSQRSHAEPGAQASPEADAGRPSAAVDDLREAAAQAEPAPPDPAQSAPSSGFEASTRADSTAAAGASPAPKASATPAPQRPVTATPGTTPPTSKPKPPPSEPARALGSRPRATGNADAAAAGSEEQPPSGTTPNEAKAALDAGSPDPRRPAEPRVNGHAPRAPAAAPRERGVQVNGHGPKPAAAEPLKAAAAAERTERWRGILTELEATRPDLAAVLKHAVPLEVSPDRLTLGYPSGSALEGSARSEDCLAVLGASAAKLLGKPPRIGFESVSGGTETLADAERRQRQARERELRDRAQRHQSVLIASEVLGAKVKRIELGEG